MATPPNNKSAGAMDSFHHTLRANGEVDAAARIKSTIGIWKSAMNFTLPPLASNDLLCRAFRKKCLKVGSQTLRINHIAGRL
jgi:hypothetical protein